MRRSDWEPMKFDYQEMGNGYLAELSYKRQKTSLNVPENVPDTRKSSVKKVRMQSILTIITNNNTVTLSQMAKICRVDMKTIKRDIDELKKIRIIKRIGPDKGGYRRLSHSKKRCHSRVCGNLVFRNLTIYEIPSAHSGYKGITI